MTDKKPPQLHQLLAVQGDLEGKWKRVKDEAIITFTKRADHFTGFDKRLQMFDAKDERLEESGASHKELTTTVDKKLEYIRPDGTRFFDALLQKEATNQDARADLAVDGVTLGTDLPATWLLGMEQKLKELRAVYETIPTLAPGIKWEADETLGKGVYRNEHNEVKLKTEQDIAYKIIQPQDANHPAQVETWKENKPVGQYTTQHVSGCLSPAQKSALLERIDKLARATKKARTRANNTEAKKLKIGKEIFNFIHAV